MSAEHDTLTAEGRLLARLIEAAEHNDDPENAHSLADDALLAYAESQVSLFQAHDIRQAWDDVKRWYA